MPLTYRDPLQVSTADAPTHSVIWLHGLGADGSDFLPVLEEFDLDRLPPLRFIFPHAPLQAVTINQGYVMPSWYDILALDKRAAEDEAGLLASVAYLNKLIENETARGIAEQNIVLAGFSQGGNVALNTALRHPRRLAGALILSSYLGLPHKLAGAVSAANRDLPIFMAHGIQDDVVSYAYAQASHAVLEDLNYAVAWHEYPMRHTLCAPEIQDIETWLARVLSTH